jgi:peptide chain release factor 2
LYELELQKKQDQIDAVNAQKKDIAWGSQIRSYVMQPYRMVKDLRTNTETSDVESVLNGKIDQFIEAYLIQFGASSDPTLVD